MEYSDIPLSQVLLQLPDHYRDKAKTAILLCHRLKRPPSDSAAFMMRLFRPRTGYLIVGQKAER